MSRRRNALTAGAILFGFVIVAVVLVQLRPDPFLPPPPPRTPFVTTVPAEARSGPIPVYGAGTVRPWAQIDVAPQVNGKVSWVEPAFQSGGRIRGGQVLFRIDDADYINRVRQASANVAAQQVALLQAGEEARIAKAEYERFRIRRTGNTVPPDASPLTLREPQLAAARAALARDSAILADAELALSRTQVRAPFSGVVRGESVDLGRFVAAGQGVGRIYADDAVEVVVPLSDADAGLIPGLWQLRAGDGDSRVRARVTARYGESGYAWEGYVDRAEAALDEQTRTIGVVVRVPDPFAGGVPEAHRPAGTDGGPPLLVGQFVDVQIEGIAPAQYFVVPRPALRPGDEVWLLRDDSLVTIVPVQVLQRSRRSVFVAGALEAGQAVVVAGIAVATEGMRVRPGSEEGPPGTQPGAR